MTSPWTNRCLPTLTASITFLSSSARRNLLTRIEPVRSVISKHSTAPPFLTVRLVTAITSPSTVTLPDSRFSVRISTGRALMALPKSTSPFGASPLWDTLLTAGAVAGLGRG